MPLIDRYLFRQLLGPTLLAVAALTGVALLSESLSALDVIVDDRQSALVFAKVIVLAMPQLIAIILPVAVLIGALVGLNRLHTEQEIVICFAGGMSRWSVVAPAVRLAGAVSLVGLVISLWIQPVSYRALRRTLAGARADAAATMIRPGKFAHPAPGVTVFAQSVGDEGVIRNLFIDRIGRSGRETTVTAREARLQTRGGAPMLLLRQGAEQEVSKSGVLNVLSFDQYALDLRPFLPADRPVRYKLSDLYLHELFFPGGDDATKPGDAARRLAEGHSRIAGSLYALAFMALAVFAVIGGPFSRMGYGARIAAAAGVALASRMLGLAAQGAAGGQPALNAIQYAIPLAVGLGAFALLFATRRAPKDVGLRQAAAVAA